MGFALLEAASEGMSSLNKNQTFQKCGCIQGQLKDASGCRQNANLHGGMIHIHNANGPQNTPAAKFPWITQGNQSEYSRMSVILQHF